MELYTHGEGSQGEQRGLNREGCERPAGFKMGQSIPSVSLIVFFVTCEE